MLLPPLSALTRRLEVGTLRNGASTADEQRWFQERLIHIEDAAMRRIPTASDFEKRKGLVGYDTLVFAAYAANQAVVAPFLGESKFQAARAELSAHPEMLAFIARVLNIILAEPLPARSVSLESENLLALSFAHREFDDVPPSVNVLLCSLVCRVLCSM